MSNGLRHLSKMLLGFDELQWQQDEHNERQAWARLSGAHECGWLIESVGTALNAGWDIRNPTGGQLVIRTTISGATELVDRTRANSVRPYLGVDRDGHVLEILPGDVLLDDAGAEIAVPDDGVWYTLIARYATTPIEPGSLTITGGSATVVGVGTQFTRYTDVATRPTILRIDPADTANGNEGAYRISSITDDTTVVLESAPPNSESGVPYRVQGRFFNGTPADPDVHANATVTWELVARTTTRPTDALIAFDVRRSAGVFSKIDRRRANLFRPIQPSNQCMTLLPITQVSYGGGGSNGLAKLVEDHPILLSGGGGGTLAMAVAMAPAATGSHITALGEDQPTGMLCLTLYDNGTTRKVNVLAYTQAASGTRWDDPDGGSTVDLVTGGGITDCDLLAIPSASGNTHAAFYCDSAGTVQQKLSPDNGATWGSAAAVWNPAGTDKVTKVDAVLTRCGRIVLVGLYSTGTARVRYVFSNDLGATWDTNTNAGYSIGGDSTTTDVSVCEDDRGNLWTISAEDRAGAGGLRMYRGGSEGTPIPDPAEQTDGWPLGPAVTADSVDCFAMPNGLVGAVLGEHTSSSDSYIRLVVATRQQALHQRELVTEAQEGDSSNTATPVGVGVSAAGVVFLGWGITDTGSHDVQTQILQYQPAAAQRTWTWYGGQ